MANNRKYKTDPELLLARGKAIVAAGEEARYLRTWPKYMKKSIGSCSDCLLLLS